MHDDDKSNLSGGSKLCIYGCLALRTVTEAKDAQIAGVGRRTTRRNNHELLIWCCEQRDGTTVCERDLGRRAAMRLWRIARWQWLTRGAMKMKGKRE